MSDDVLQDLADVLAEGDPEYAGLTGQDIFDRGVPIGAAEWANTKVTNAIFKCAVFSQVILSPGDDGTIELNV